MHCVPSSGTRCLAGDWLALSSELQQGYEIYSCRCDSIILFICLRKYSDLPCFFDIILSAETLYSSESSVKVYRFKVETFCRLPDSSF